MNVFIHYLDKELLGTLASAQNNTELIDKLTLSIKVAILLLEDNECIYVPASNYFESELCRVVLERFREIIDFGLINFASSSESLEIFLEKKQVVHPGVYNCDNLEEKKAIIMEKNIPGIWLPRQGSATEDIMNGWNMDLDSEQWEYLYRRSKYRSVSSFQKHLEKIPASLDNKAFLVENVLPKLKINPLYIGEAGMFINGYITQQYIGSFLKEYNAVCFKNFFLVKHLEERILPKGYEHIDYMMLCRKLLLLGYKKSNLYEYLTNCNNYELLKLKEEKVLYELLEKNGGANMPIKASKTTKSFIVHGHDETELYKLKDYIQNTLKLGEPIILAQQASGGLTIIEKFEKFADEAALVFVLLTPDDEFGNGNKMRARQNVIFEMGYFLGKIGRQEGRVLLLYKGELDLPSDISGLVYINIDHGVESAGETIRKELASLLDNRV